MFLEVESLELRHGALQALAGFSLAMEEGEVVAVLGANGAGKSSLMRCLIGSLAPWRGRLRFAGRDITADSTASRIRQGLVLVPEGRRILTTLTVHENLLMGAYGRRDSAAIRGDLLQVYDRFPNLAERRNRLASVLSGGEQQMLAIGRARLARPRLLMLDEPSLGLSPKLVEELFQLLAELHRGGMSVLLVEQNTRKALGFAHRAYVLDRGRIALSGSARELLDQRALLDAYLGAGHPGDMRVPPTPAKNGTAGEAGDVRQTGTGD